MDKDLYTTECRSQGERCVDKDPYTAENRDVWIKICTLQSAEE